MGQKTIIHPVVNQQEGGIFHHRISAIIPAYNEAKRIGVVIKTLIELPIFSEIIVVDDGSVDNTASVVKQLMPYDTRLKLIQHEQNLGKGEAFFTAQRSTKADYILMLDADLINLKKDHVIDLILPVLADQADMTVGIFRGGNIFNDFSHWIMPWLSGQRCFKVDLLHNIDQKAASGYGLETTLSMVGVKLHWRIKNVPLIRVFHPVKEFHRGLWHGIISRAQMWMNILRAWQITRRLPVNEQPHRNRAKFFLIFFLLILGTLLVYDRVNAVTFSSSKTLPELSLANIHRILIIAPHPDDETLGSGGLIQDAQAQGIQVKVVLITNGDGQPLAPMAFEKQMKPKAKDYILMGENRQQESLNGLSQLGLEKQNVYFLGYPDRGISHLWLKNWQKDCPLQAIFTRVKNNPYPMSFDPGISYCGNNLLNDLVRIIGDYEPDLVVLPHPNDEHPDHWSSYAFTEMAVLLVNGKNPSYNPDLYGYLVHYGNYPQPRRIHLQDTLSPPSTLTGGTNLWHQLELTDGQERVKLKAIQDYKTQIRLLGSFLPSFARRNELFTPIHPIHLLPLSMDILSVYDSKLEMIPVLKAPNEKIRRRLTKGADLIGWKVVRLGRTLSLEVDTRGNLVPDLHYLILVKTPDGVTHTYETRSSFNSSQQQFFSIQLDLDQIGNPPVIGFAAEVKELAIIDHTGWYFATMGNWMP